MDDKMIIHSGVAHDDDPPGRGSGRYGWGTGENPYQHQMDFLSEVSRLEKQGMTQSEIAKILLGVKYVKKDGTEVWNNSSDLRAEMSIKKSEVKRGQIARARELLEECHGNVSEVGRRMGKNESSIRSLLKDDINERNDRYQNTADMIKKRLKEVDSGIIDISSGTEYYMGVADYTRRVAVSILEKEGYIKTYDKSAQASDPHKFTNFVLLADPEKYTKEDGSVDRYKIHQAFKNGEVGTITEFTPDEGKTWWKPEFPESLDSKRVFIRYGDQGGKEKDGVIELRQGVEDISLGNSQYAQVRIAVDGTHYMKGMAIYGDIPEGYDVVYNTNKKTGTPALGDEFNSVLKPLKEKKDANGNKTGEVDRDNPFGALIKSPKDRDGVIQPGGQRHYIGEDGKDHLSPINKLQDEGDWDTWSRNLSSQFLSKQPLKLIKQQLNLSVDDKKVELEKIMNLTNPVIKKKMLEDFAEGCDLNAADLSAKGFKNQAFQVLLPISTLKDNEIYAPNYENGDVVALVRYPHAGTFEIPILKVNNNHKDAKKYMGNAKDAVGINTEVAERLSGADFDGDTAIVIPLASNNINVVQTDKLKGLENWDPKAIYKLPDTAPKMKNSTKQREMGIVTNLITDMTVGGASQNKICRAVKHSMVVIDAEKHHLDYKKSFEDNNISELKKEFQGKSNSSGDVSYGASTILSRSKAEGRTPSRKEVKDVNKMTPEEVKRYNEGYKIWHYTGETTKQRITDPNKMTPGELKVHNAGKKVWRDSNTLVTQKVHQMDLVDDAFDLVRDKNNQKEVAYANYANSLKAIARYARKEARAIKPYKVSTEAKKTYKVEVEDLNRQLRLAEMNRPKERIATNMADAKMALVLKSNPDMDYEHQKRERARLMNEARAAVGAKKEKITISDKQWEAIQANAVSSNTLSKILLNTDQEKFKQRATPKHSPTSLTTAEINMIKSMLATGMYSQSEIADRFKVSVSTIRNYM